MLAGLDVMEFNEGRHVESEMSAPWPIDLVHLRRYTLGDLQLERDVLDLFAGELPKTLAALETANTEKEWKMASHTLKGSARAVGAWRVARAATAAERHPESLTDAGLRGQLISAVEASVDEAIAYIRTLHIAA